MRGVGLFMSGGSGMNDGTRSRSMLLLGLAERRGLVWFMLSQVNGSVCVCLGWHLGKNAAHTLQNGDKQRGAELLRGATRVGMCKKVLNWSRRLRIFRYFTENLF